MFIHLGADVSVMSKSIISVINLEEVPPSQKETADFINSEDEINRLQYLTDDIPRTLIVTDEKTYVSSLSSAVLQRRLAGNISD